MFLTPESIRLVSGKATSLACPAGSRVQTPPEAPNHSSKPRLFFVPLAKCTSMADARVGPSVPETAVSGTDSRRFREGRGARKSTTPGGHRLVSRKEKLQGKKIVRAKEKLRIQRGLFRGREYTTLEGR